MSEDQAKQHLIEMLDRFTIGSVLHLLADVQHNLAEQARLDDDAVLFEWAKMIENTLFVVGMGIDAAMPS